MTTEKEQSNSIILHILDGQYLSSRLSRNINNQSSLLKRLLAQYNNLSSISPKENLTWAEATDISSARWMKCSYEEGLCVPRDVKLNAIKYHHLLLRCDEEVKLLCKEMESCLSFCMGDWEELMNAITEIMENPCSKYSNDALTLLQLERLKCEAKLTKLVSSFSHYVDVVHLPIERFLALQDYPKSSGII